MRCASQAIKSLKPAARGNYATSAGELRQTPLHSLHKKEAQMAPFAGFDMPLYYTLGGAAEHKHTRTAASLFDVSHMVQSTSVAVVLVWPISRVLNQAFLLCSSAYPAKAQPHSSTI